MKQTLFEAEAVISVNTDKMFADLDKAAREAKKRLQDALGGISAPTIGGGRGGSGGGRGGGRSYTDVMFGENMKYARMERSVGQYADAIQRLKTMMDNYKLSAMQATEAETLLQRIQAQRNKIQGDLQKKADKDFQNAQKANARGSVGAYGNTGGAVTTMFQQEMALARTAKAAKDYSEAIARLTALTNNNSLSTKQNAQAQAALTNALRAQGKAEIKAAAMSGPGGTGPGGFPKTNPDARRRNAQVQNASFAVQDFVTVLSMGGGMTRALASASNNLAFMTAMMGTTGGAVAGLALTLGAVLLPSLAKAALGMEDLSEATERANKRLQDAKKAAEDAARAYDRYNEAKAAGAKGETGVIEALADKRGDLSKYGAQLEAARAASRGAVIATAGEQAGSFGRMETMLRGTANPVVAFIDKFQMMMRKVQAGTAGAGELRAEAQTVPWAVDSLLGLTDKYNLVADALEESGRLQADYTEKIEDTNRSLDLLNEKIKVEVQAREAIAAKTRSVFEFTGVGGYGKDVFKDFFAEGQKQAKEALRKDKDRLQTRLGAQQGIFETLFPKEAEIEKIKKQFADAFGTNISPGMQAARDRQISEVMKGGRQSITGQMGGAAFSQQLTNQLLQRDPMTKIAEYAAKQTGLQEEIKTAVQGSQKALEAINTSPFSSN